MGIDKYIKDESAMYDPNLDRDQFAKQVDTLNYKVRKKMENEFDGKRKVSPFFTCNLREIGDHGRLSSESTELTVWMNKDDSSYNNMFKVGNYIKCYNVNTTQRIKSNSNNCQLSASSRTDFEKIDKMKVGIDQQIMRDNYTKYISKSKEYYDFDPENMNVYSHSFDDDNDININYHKNMMQQFEFNMIGCIIKQYNDKLFVMNLNGFGRDEIVSIYVKQDECTIHYSSKLREGSVYIIKDLIYNGYDNKLNIHTASTERYTQFISSNNKDNIYKDCVEYIKSDDGKRGFKNANLKIDTKILI